MSPNPEAARIGASAAPGCVVVVARYSVAGSSSALPGTTLITARIHPRLGDTP